MTEAALHEHILAYLASASERHPENESLEVALQCLREAYATTTVDSGATLQQTATASAPGLLQIFEAGVAARAAQSSPSRDAAQAPDFQSFVDNLSRRGFFEGIERGGSEYEDRMRTARAHA